MTLNLIFPTLCVNLLAPVSVLSYSVSFYMQ